MTMTATRDALSVLPAPQAAHGFPGLPCPKCGEVDGVQLNLTDCSCHCVECEADFELDDVRDLIERWSGVLTWIALAPALPSA